ncbi:MAG: hypothetical protein RML33_11185 [Acidobacteriota bacterium]|nr:hypothetical protein [Leptospiraceae bacterium]MDW8305384.1 hypothetical protein [Acidobacteriota bacterium]
MIEVITYNTLEGTSRRRFSGYLIPPGSLFKYVASFFSKDELLLLTVPLGAGLIYRKWRAVNGNNSNIEKKLAELGFREISIINSDRGGSIQINARNTTSFKNETDLKMFLDKVIRDTIGYSPISSILVVLEKQGMKTGNDLRYSPEQQRWERQLTERESKKRWTELPYAVASTATTEVSRGIGNWVANTGYLFPFVLLGGGILILFAIKR